MFPIARRHVDRVLLVEDGEIVRAQDVLWDVFRLVVEPGGAAAFAALLSGRSPSLDEQRSSSCAAQMLNADAVSRRPRHSEILRSP